MVVITLGTTELTLIVISSNIIIISAEVMTAMFMLMATTLTMAATTAAGIAEAGAIPPFLTELSAEQEAGLPAAVASLLA